MQSLISPQLKVVVAVVVVFSSIFWSLVDIHREELNDALRPDEVSQRVIIERENRGVKRDERSKRSVCVETHCTLTVHSYGSSRRGRRLDFLSAVLIMRIISTNYNNKQKLFVLTIDYGSTKRKGITQTLRELKYTCTQLEKQCSVDICFLIFSFLPSEQALL